MISDFERGAIWRKWDLHIHSPHSVLNSNWKLNSKEYVAQIIKRSREEEVFALGITDYFAIDGYIEFLSLIKDADFKTNFLSGADIEHLSKMLIIPNIEFRGSEIVTNNGKTGRPNFHVLFSDTVEPEDIQNAFLNSLKITTSGIGTVTDRCSLRRADIERLGKRLKVEHSNFSDQSDAFAGMMNIAVNIEDVVDVLRESKSLFDGKWLLAVSADEDLSNVSWDSQGHLRRKLYSQYANIVFSGNLGTRDFYLGRKHDSLDAYKSEFGPQRPCMSFCDAHSESELFRYSMGRATWIKADLTFAGLLQTLNEPEDRVYIGEEPPSSQRSKRDSSKIIDSIVITAKSPSQRNADWFNCDVPLNSGMVAVIGNKGSGKSALADIIALTCRTKPKDFSFLNSERFRNRKTGKASEYSATITWLDKNTESIDSLSEDPTDSDTAHIQYLPQSALERICNDIQGGKKSEFYNEIEAVVFRHLPEEDRLWYTNLSDLIDSEMKDVDKLIEQQKTSLREQNKLVIEEEKKTTEDHQKRLQNLITNKEREVISHDNSKPTKVEEPDLTDEPDDSQRQFRKQIAQSDSDIKKMEEEISAAIEKRKQARLGKQAATSIIDLLDEIKLQHISWQRKMEANLQKVGLTFNQIVEIKVIPEEIERIKKAFSEEIEASNAIIDESVQESVAFHLMEKKSERDSLVEKLGEPQRLYDEYLTKLDKWTKDKHALVGSKDEPDSLEGLLAQLLDAKDAPKRLTEAYRIRLEICKEIHKQKCSQRNRYKEYYKPVQKLTASQSTVGQAANFLRFKVFVRDSGFANKFLEMINQGRSGTFHGVKEGREVLEKMSSAIDWDNVDEVVSFVERLRISLTKNTNKASADILVSDQLKDLATVEDIWNTIYSLEWLEPTFTLEWNGTPIETLSPGERGTLLLIFYLLLDERTEPLIIDQPEENLDNETIYSVLVPCIREARKRRQIIMITHNPNIAVVCDADQIIYARKDMSQSPKISYACGSIENPKINQLLVDVLEGTKPAFDMRDAKYYLNR